MTAKELNSSNSFLRRSSSLDSANSPSETLQSAPSPSLVAG